MRVIKGSIQRKPKTDSLYQGLVNIGWLRWGDRRVGVALYGIKKCRYFGVIPNVQEPLEYVNGKAVTL